MITRKQAIATLYASSSSTTRFVSALGRISRDLNEIGGGDPRCFFCLGSMGNVIPLTLGLAIAHPSLHFVAVEGDGSLLMSLGSLATMRRYPCNNMRLIIMDNKMYESTGGQAARDPFIDLVALITTIIPKVSLADSEDRLKELVNRSIIGPEVIVVPCAPQEPSPRIPIAPLEVKERFIKTLI